jgi:hypothetical protein
MDASRIGKRLEMASQLTEEPCNRVPIVPPELGVRLFWARPLASRRR